MFKRYFGLAIYFTLSSSLTFKTGYKSSSNVCKNGSPFSKVTFLTKSLPSISTKTTLLLCACQFWNSFFKNAIMSPLKKNGSHLRNCLLPFRRMSPLPFQNPRKQLLPLLRQTLCSLFGKALRTDLNGSFNSIAKSVHGWPKL